MTTQFVTVKSSAVSVWIFPGLGGRESVAILPSGLPVEKEKEAAEAGDASKSKVIKAVPRTRTTVLAAFVLTKQGFGSAGILR